MIAALVVLGLYIALLVAISYFSLHPARVPIFFSPAALGSPQEEVEFESDGFTLRGWWVPVANPKACAVLVHGYLMNRSELAVVAHKLAAEGIACLLLDLRAHGRSGGKKSGLGAVEHLDVGKAIDFVRQKHPDAPVILYGSSMGAAASVFAAREHPREVVALILDSCYGSLSQAVLGWWRFLGGRALAIALGPSVIVCAPMAGFNPFKVDVAKALKGLDIPILFLHGEKDNLALPSEAKRNLEAAGAKARIVWFGGCGHSEGRWVHPERYDAAVLSFLRDVGF